MEESKREIREMANKSDKNGKKLLDETGEKIENLQEKWRRKVAGRRIGGREKREELKEKYRRISLLFIFF